MYLVLNSGYISAHNAKSKYSLKLSAGMILLKATNILLFSISSAMSEQVSYIIEWISVRYDRPSSECMSPRSYEMPFRGCLTCQIVLVFRVDDFQNMN